MKTIVLGATGGTGIEIVKRAVLRGHAVTAFVRSPKALTGIADVNVIAGDVLNVAELTQAISGHDAVLSAFGPRNPRSHEPLMRSFAQGLTAAMARSNVSRLIVLSVAFLFRNSVIPPAYPAGKLLFGHHVTDCADMEEIVQQSKLDWTIVRPPQLTNKPRSGKYRVGVGRLPFFGFTISRADVADFMVQTMEQDVYARQIIGLAN